AIQAVGCIAARMCHTNNCPTGVATQKPELRALIDIDAAATRLATFLGASVELMQVLARACGHDSLGAFSLSDLTTWKKDMAELSGVRFGGPGES
ncbi:MAG: glutamate synthase-related protein, partial [Woeseiaceae bacterium]